MRLRKMTRLPDGSILFEDGQPPPQRLLGYVPDASNPRRFVPDFPACIHREYVMSATKRH